MYPNFTSDVKQILDIADLEAKNFYQVYLTSEFVIAAVLKSDAVPDILANIKYDIFYEKLVKLVEMGPPIPVDQLMLSFKMRLIYNKLSNNETVTITDLVNEIFKDKKDIAFKIISEIRQEQLYQSKLALFDMTKFYNKNIPQDIFQSIIQKI
jgi:hypothetical protein